MNNSLRRIAAGLLLSWVILPGWAQEASEEAVVPELPSASAPASTDAESAKSASFRLQFGGDEDDAGAASKARGITITVDADDEESSPADREVERVIGKLEAALGRLPESIRSELDDEGMAFDFTVLKKALDQVLDQFDHHNLNEVPPFETINPSSENIARVIYEELSALLPGVHLAQVDIDDPAANGCVGGGLEVFERGEPHDFGLDPAARRGGRMAQRSGRQGLGVVADDGGRAFAPLPAHQREGFDADVLEALAAQIVGRPYGGVLFGLRPRRPRAEARGQLGDVVQGDVGAHRRVAHDDSLLNGGRVLGVRQGREDGEAQR